MSNNIKIASLFSCNKQITPSHGTMYETQWDNRGKDDAINKLKVYESINVGVKSNRPGGASAMDETVANPKLVDMCELSAGFDTLVLDFTIKFGSGILQPASCNEQLYLSSFKKSVSNYIEKHEFKELAKRYAINIASGRFLWRNRVAEEIEVVVTAGELELTFNSLKYALNDFNVNDDVDINILAELIADSFSGKVDFSIIKVRAFSRIGDAQDVYPSQEWVIEKNFKSKNDKSNKGKVLCQKDGVAGMHGRKIGNAIRTIDNWFPDNKDNRVISVDACGTVANLNTAFRATKGGNDFYSLFDAFVTRKKLISENDEHYVMAMLIRGGVFGGKV